MSTAGKMSLESAEKIAMVIVEKLKPYCEKIEVAGSIRRRKAWVNDLDIVLTPKDLWGLQSQLPDLFKAPSMKMSGEKTARMVIAGVQVDFYFASKENWATLLLIRTGSKENNIRLCVRAKERGWHLHANGDGLFNEKGERIAGDTELSIYNALGLPYQSPEKRK